MPGIKGKGVYIDKPLEYLYLRDKYSWIKRHRLHFSLKKALRKSLEKGGAVCVADRQIALEVHRYYKVPLERISIISKDRYIQELRH